MSNNVKEIRKKIGMSRAELSRRSGVSVRTIDDWENGRKIARDVYLIEKVARALNCTIYDLIDFGEDERPIVKNKSQGDSSDGDDLNGTFSVGRFLGLNKMNS